jgi:hypothetical protein
MQILEDVSEEHARKTITVDPHPNNPNVQAASIHPCKHAEVMRRLVARLGQDVEVKDYLILFIKFIASVIPTIEYAPLVPEKAPAINTHAPAPIHWHYLAYSAPSCVTRAARGMN